MLERCKTAEEANYLSKSCQDLLFKVNIWVFLSKQESVIMQNIRFISMDNIHPFPQPFCAYSKLFVITVYFAWLTFFTLFK